MFSMFIEKNKTNVLVVRWKTNIKPKITEKVVPPLQDRSLTYRSRREGNRLHKKVHSII